MRVLLTPEAAAMLESRKRWWRENRPATADLFERELLEAVGLSSASTRPWRRLRCRCVDASCTAS